MQMGTGCGNDIIEYLDTLADTYPIMSRWSTDPITCITHMTRLGYLDAIIGINCICDCIDSNVLQNIAYTASRYGHMHIVQWTSTQGYIDMQKVAFIARDAGYDELASYADGYEYVIEDDEFPLNLTALTGDPNEDKAKWIFDYRMQDYREEFLPEDPLIIEEDGYDDGSPLEDDDNDSI